MSNGAIVGSAEYIVSSTACTNLAPKQLTVLKKEFCSIQDSFRLFPKLSAAKAKAGGFIGQQIKKIKLQRNPPAPAKKNSLGRRNQHETALSLWFGASGWNWKTENCVDIFESLVKIYGNFFLQDILPNLYPWRSSWWIKREHGGLLEQSERFHQCTLNLNATTKDHIRKERREKIFWGWFVN